MVDAEGASTASIIRITRRTKITAKSFKTTYSHLSSSTFIVNVDGNIISITSYIVAEFSILSHILNIKFTTHLKYVIRVVPIDTSYTHF